jgi:hypothetical protein
MKTKLACGLVVEITGMPDGTILHTLSLGDAGLVLSRRYSASETEARRAAFLVAKALLARASHELDVLLGVA